MHMLLKPVVKITNQLSFTQKVGVLLLMFMLPMSAMMGLSIHNTNQDIQTQKIQLKGLSFSVKIKKLAITIARHRSLMMQYLQNPNASSPKAIKSLEVTVDSQMTELQKTFKDSKYSDLKSAPSWQDMNRKWQKVKQDGSIKHINQNFSTHSQLVSDLFLLVGIIADDSDMTQQPTANDFKLMELVISKIPRFQESLSQLEGKSAGLIADETLSTQEGLLLRSLLTLTQKDDRTLKNDLTILFKNKSLESSLRPEQLKLLLDVDRFIKSIESNLLGSLLSGKSLAVTSQDVLKQGSQAIETLELFNQAAIEILVEKNEIHLQNILFKRNCIILVFLSIFIFAVYFSMGFVSGIHDAIKDMVFAMERLKQGDFTIRANVQTKDVLGKMSNNLNEMVDGIAHLIVTVQNSTHELKDASVSLENMSASCHSEINTQNDQTELVATAAVQMAASVKHVAESCNETAKTTCIANEAALEGKEIVDQNIDAINQLSTGVKETASIIDHVKTNVDKISGVVEVIHEISEQTNLLALNAAIEAARAGEQGRGFAVVADEVRSLARRTNSSTAEIQEMIENLQKGSDHAVKITEQSQEYARLSVQRSDHAREALLKIVDQAESLMKLNTEVAMATDEQSSVAEEISNNTQILNGSVQNLLQQVQNTAQSSNQLKNNAVNLEDLLDSFRV